MKIMRILHLPVCRFIHKKPPTGLELYLSWQSASQARPCPRIRSSVLSKRGDDAHL